MRKNTRFEGLSLIDENSCIFKYNSHSINIYLMFKLQILIEIYNTHF